MANCLECEETLVRLTFYPYCSARCVDKQDAFYREPRINDVISFARQRGGQIYRVIGVSDLAVWVRVHNRIFKVSRYGWRNLDPRWSN